MTCFHPLKAWKYGVRPETGKALNKITSSDVVAMGFADGKWKRFYHVPTPIERYSYKIYEDFTYIPCGQCVGCRLDYARQWAVRIMLECKEYKDNYFLTLTYNDENLPEQYSANPERHFDPETGEVLKVHSLKKDEISKFMKALRQKYKKDFGLDGIRFYGCGEYGDRTGRPHYHAILFNLPIPDLKVYKTSFSGDVYYTSEYINSIWKKGYVVIGQVTFESASYVARYIMKKQKKPNEEKLRQMIQDGTAAPYSNIKDEFGMQEEFVVMSRMPGIGQAYFDNNVSSIYKDDKIYLPGGRISKPPRYFDRLLEDLNPGRLEEVKENRREVMEVIQQEKLQHTSLNYLDCLANEEKTFLKRKDKLVRPLG